jgi:HK97 family phage major capsid protein
LSAIFTERELAKYSVSRAISQIVESQKNQHPGYPGRLSGLELEVHDALRSHFYDTPAGEASVNGFLLPINALKGLSAGQFTTGGALVNSEFAASIVPALRSRSVCVEMGATVFEGLRGDVLLPSETTTGSAQWLAELEAAADGSDPTFAQTKLSPKRVVALTRVTKQLLNQSSLGVENFMRNDLLSVVATALDKAALVGSGSVQPLGLLNRTDTNTVTFSGAASFSKAIDMQSSVALDNASTGNLGYVTSPGSAAKWMLKTKDTTGIGFLWDGDINSGTVAGAPARSTTQIAAGSDQVVFGSWAGLALGIFHDSLEVIVDSYTLKKQALVEIQVTLLADVGVWHPENFCISTDSGAQ